MRAVLDPNVLISAALSPRGARARVLRAWLDGAFELIMSDMPLTELAADDVLAAYRPAG